MLDVSLEVRKKIMNVFLTIGLENIFECYWTGNEFTVYGCRNLGKYTLFWSTAKGVTFRCIFNNGKGKSLKQLQSTLCSN